MTWAAAVQCYWNNRIFAITQGLRVARALAFPRTVFCNLLVCEHRELRLGEHDKGSCFPLAVVEVHWRGRCWITCLSMQLLSLAVALACPREAPSALP